MAYTSTKAIHSNQKWPQIPQRRFSEKYTILFSLYISIVIRSSSRFVAMISLVVNLGTNVQVLCVNVENLIACMHGRFYVGEISCPVVLA